MDSRHVATWIGLHPLRREPERRVGLFRTAYVPYYKCLCPNQEGTAEFLLNLYGKVADIPEVDYIHLDISVTWMSSWPADFGKIRLGDGRGISYGGLLLL